MSNPESQLEIIKAKQAEANKRLKEKLLQLEDALQDLTIKVKYLMFDNEALKRENDNLRKKLEDEKDNC